MKYIILLAAFLSLVTGCKREKKHTAKIVLVNEENSADSIVFFYKYLSQNKAQISQSFYIDNDHYSNTFYLHQTDTITYLGVKDANKDTVYLSPYYSIADTIPIYYDTDYSSGKKNFTQKIREENNRIYFRGNLAFTNITDTIYWSIKKSKLGLINDIKIGSLEFARTSVNIELSQIHFDFSTKNKNQADISSDIQFVIRQ